MAAAFSVNAYNNPVVTFKQGDIIAINFGNSRGKYLFLSNCDSQLAYDALRIAGQVVPGIPQLQRSDQPRDQQINVLSNRGQRICGKIAIGYRVTSTGGRLSEAPVSRVEIDVMQRANARRNAIVGALDLAMPRDHIGLVLEYVIMTKEEFSRITDGSIPNITDKLLAAAEVYENDAEEQTATSSIVV